MSCFLLAVPVECTTLPAPLVPVLRDLQRQDELPALLKREVCLLREKLSWACESACPTAPRELTPAVAKIKESGGCGGGCCHAGDKV